MINLKESILRKNIRQTAEILGVSVKTVRRYLDNGKLKWSGNQVAAESIRALAAERAIPDIERHFEHIMKYHIYFLQEETTKYIKIGITLNLKTRIQGYATIIPTVTKLLHSFTTDDARVERALHIMFKQHRVKGEWFSDHPEILEHIDKLKTRGGQNG